VIQSDFVTQENRQDIVKTSRRNLGILDAIGSAFVDAVRELSSDENIPYKWMQFLPDKDNDYGAFWSQLLPKIDTLLRKWPVVWPRIPDAPRRRITELRQVPETYLDEHGSPLFKDLTSNSGLYISGWYFERDLKKLRAYGLPYLHVSEFLDTVQQDLASSYARIRDVDWEAQWHTKFAECLIEIVDDSKCPPDLLRRIHGMRLLPLQDCTWVSPSDSGDVYFAHAEGISIPEDIGLRLLHPEAEVNCKRKDLFTKLGVISPTVSFVRETITSLHANCPRDWHPQLSSYVDHARFLYDTHHLVADPMKGSSGIYIGRSDNRYSRPGSRDIYLPDEHPFGAKSLWEQLKQSSGKSKSELNVKLVFIHDAYLNNTPPKPIETAERWLDWLCSYAGVRRHLRLLKEKDRGVLSKECRSIAKHLPDKFVGFLSYCWEIEGEELEESSTLLSQLKGFEVSCQDSCSVEKLSKTYLPLPELQQQCQRYLPRDCCSSFPFLELGKPVEQGGYQAEWGFLVKNLGVGVNQDLEFVLRILLCWVNDKYIEATDDPLKIVGLLSIIHGKYSESPAKEIVKERIL
jgi:hypothetical protein